MKHDIEQSAYNRNYSWSLTAGVADLASLGTTSHLKKKMEKGSTQPARSDYATQCLSCCLLTIGSCTTSVCTE
jgi:hypothetical protein